MLMAVAIGARSDFLTPIGHQCSTLVMGPGGYRFGHYWRRGLPLSILVVLIPVSMLLVWAIEQRPIRFRSQNAHPKVIGPS